MFRSALAAETEGVPRLALMLGDRYGIGPELVARFIADPPELKSRVIILGDRRVLEQGIKSAGTGSVPEAIGGSPDDIRRPGLSFQDFPSPKLEVEPLGRVSRDAGAEVLRHLEMVSGLCDNGTLSGFVFAPLNKQAMRSAGLKGQDELDHLVDNLGYDAPVGEINILGDLWTSRVTAHIPLKDVANAITGRSVRAAISLLAESLERAGIDTPRIAVAGLNPHAGDGGAFGDEEIEIIGPAIETAKTDGYAVSGPYSPDTVFLQAPRDQCHGIVTMYHDQGQIAMKLIGFGKGVTLQAGLPFPVTTPAHGTAYDIAGQGKATSEGLYAAFNVAERMVLSG